VKTRHKLLVVLAAACAVLAVLTVFFVGRTMRADQLARQRERLGAETSILAAWVADAPGFESVQRFAAERGRALGLRITLIGKEGTVLADSARQSDELAAMESHLSRPEIQAAASGGSGWSVRRSETFNVDYLYVAARVPGAGPVGFVRAAYPYERVEAAAAKARNRVFLFALASLLALAGVAYLGARRLSKPVEEIAAAAERAALGEPGDAPALDGGGEIGRLARAIARMKESLTEKISEIEEEQRFLLSVLGGMREGLLLVGPDRRIRLANEAFRQVFGLPFDPTGRMLAEVIRDPNVLRDLESARSEDREVRSSLVEAVSGRSFEIRVTPLPARGGGTRDALFLFLDVTRLEALESVRQEFVANVSHELRTPLTSIKAFVETLLEGRLQDPENSLKFLGIVQKHADRMDALIDDLTDLSLIETGAITLQLRPVDLNDLAHEVAANLEPHSRRSQVELRVEIPEGFEVRADRRRLEQILVNLIENGIKFNKPGGSVTVSASTVDARPVVVVEDTGVGIPADSAEQVFHRFYRVDKARSKDLGGTGLGLSIVKHLMRLHGGQVRLESELGHGARFHLEFPPES